jgi:hypothetical protein
MRHDRPTTLRNGLRVRLRLPLPSDRRRLGDFHDRLGLATDDITAIGLLRFDPRRRRALCAIALDGNREAMVAFGAIDRGADAPFVLLADEQHAPGVRTVLAAALREQAGTRAA